MVFDKDLFLICGGIVCRFAVKNGDLWGSSDKNSPSAKSKVGIFTPILRRGRFRGGESPSNLGRKRGMWWIWRVHNRKTARSVGKAPEKNKKPPSKDETLRRTATATRGTTQDCAKSATQAQKSRPPLTLRLRAALTEARTTDSGAISIRPHATASHLSRLSESYPSGLSPSMPFAMILA